MSVRHALLALLSEGPKYGLQLRQEFEERTGEVWPLNVGQVYTTLQRLERDGLIESDGDGRGRPAEVVPHHRRRRAPSWTTWLRTPPDLSSPPRDELVIKVLVAIRVPGVDVHDVIQTHRRHVVELMQEWTRVKRDAGAGRAEPGAGGRRRAVPARLGDPLARRRRRPAAPRRYPAGARRRTRHGADPSRDARGGGAADERAAAEPGQQGLRQRRRPRCTRCARST